MEFVQYKFDYMCTASNKTQGVNFPVTLQYALIFFLWYNLGML